MIYSLRGTLVVAKPGLAVIECGGVGYQCSISMTTLAALPQVGSEARLFTQLTVRDDAVELFGFYDRQELEFFRMLTSVGGVGNKLALALLSDFTADRLSLVISAGDAKTLTRTAGVGNKLAQRIVLELKDKTAGFAGANANAQAVSAAVSGSGAVSEAVAALTALGYNQTDAASALAGADASMGVEELIKLGLRQLAGKMF